MTASTERLQIKVKVDEITIEYMVVNTVVEMLQQLIQQHGPEVEIGAVLDDGLAYEVCVTRLEEEWEMIKRITQRKEYDERSLSAELELYRRLKEKFDSE
jgi:hypothetical protein